MSEVVCVEYIQWDGAEKKRPFKVSADCGTEACKKIDWIHRIFNTCLKNEVIAHFVILGKNGEVIMDADGKIPAV